MSVQLKPGTTVTQQIELLRSRGLLVDEALAHQWLANVSYYRLSAYWYPAREFKSTNQRGDNFNPGVSFADAVDLYEADRKLRTLVHDGIERVEVTLRTRIGEHLCNPNPLAYASPDNFRPTFDHPRWMQTVAKRIDRSAKNNEAIKH